MTSEDFERHLHELGLTQTGLAARLGVTARSVRRWQAGEQEIPGWAAEVLQAWRQLNVRNIPWGTDLESIWCGDNAQIHLPQDHDRALADVLERVKGRGGLAAPWRVNLREHSATLGRMKVSFYKLASDSFSLQSYSRSDVHPDPQRDRSLIEEAVAAFAAAVSAARTERPEQDWDA